MSQLTQHQIEDLARAVAMIHESIGGFFDNPENEQAYQEWYLRKYGQPEKGN